MIFVVRRLGDTAVDTSSEGFDTVVSGHSHRPDVRYEEGGALPQSGERRSEEIRPSRTHAFMEIDASGICPEIVGIRE